MAVETRRFFYSCEQLRHSSCQGIHHTPDYSKLCFTEMALPLQCALQILLHVMIYVYKFSGKNWSHFFKEIMHHEIF